MLAVVHNTPPDRQACAQLAARGASVFEVDVRLVADRLVATHTVRLLPRLERLRRRGLGLRLGPPYVADVDPLELAELVPPGCRVLLDCKDDSGAGAGRLATALLERVADRERFLVSSHHWASLGALADAGFAVWASVDTRRALRRVLNAPPRCDAVTVRHTLLDAATVRRLVDDHPTVVAWTVNDVARAGELGRLGVHGVTTDDASVVSAAVDM